MKGKVVPFVLGALIGGTLVHTKCSYGFLVQTLDPSLVDGVRSRPSTNDTEVGGGKAEQELRFQKYVETYKYERPVQPRKNFSSCGVGPNFTQYFGLNIKQRSRFGEDQIIYETFFKGRLIGNETFVELGAFNGVTASNTRFFDECLGWKGLLIEGNPQNYQQTVQSRPNAHRMSFAPSCSAEYEATNKTTKFFIHANANSGLPGAALTYQGRATVDVPCGPLTPALLDIFGAGGVSYFSLDVEGAEKLILDTIDFKAVRIDVMMIEVVNEHCRARQPCEVRDAVRERMKQEGYSQYTNLVVSICIY